MNNLVVNHRMTLICILFCLSAWICAGIGEVTRSIPAPGPCPTGLVWDGNMLWQLDRHTGQLQAVDPATGKVSRSLTTPGYFPAGIAWDGHFFWITDIGTSDDGTGRISQIDPATGSVVKEFDSPVQWPTGCCWENGCLWIADARKAKLLKVDPNDGSIIAEFTAPNTEPTGIAFDGRYLWVGDRGKDKIYLVDPQRGKVIFSINAPGPYVYGIAWDGQTLWCTDYQLRRIFRLRTDWQEPYLLTEPKLEHLQVTAEVRVSGPGQVEEGDVCLAVPEEGPSQHFLKGIHWLEQPSSIETDRWGQKVGFFQFKGLKMGESRRYGWEADVELRRIEWKIFPHKVGPASAIPEDIKRLYLDDAAKYDLSNPVIKKVVQEVADGESDLYWKARRLYDYVIDKLDYERTGGWESAPLALQRGNGSCSEYTFSFAALCRAAGIPARYVGTVVIRGDDASVDWVFHRWNEIYLPGYGWVPVDANHGDQASPAMQGESFGSYENRFVITTRCGGESPYLGWDYNAVKHLRTTPRCRVSFEVMAEWSPLSADLPPVK